jgi:hypothetical protein
MEVESRSEPMTWIVPVVLYVHWRRLEGPRVA